MPSNNFSKLKLYNQTINLLQIGFPCFAFTSIVIFRFNLVPEHAHSSACWLHQSTKFLKISWPGEQNFPVECTWVESYKSHLCSFSMISRMKSQIQLFRERLSNKRGKAYSTMSKVIMGIVVLRLLDWTSRCFSVEEGDSTNTCIRTFSFLVAKSP